MVTEVEEGMGEFWLANAADTLVKIGEPFNVPVPNGSADLIDASSFDTVGFKDYITARLRDGEEADIEMNWVPGSATDTLCKLARGETREFEVIVPQDGGEYKFAGSVLVRDYVRENPMGDRRTGSLRVKWVSEVVETWTPGV